MTFYTPKDDDSRFTGLLVYELNGFLGIYLAGKIMKAVKKESAGTEIDIVADKIEKKRENAKRRRLLMNAKNADKLNEEIELNKQKRPELIKERDELEAMIAEKRLHKQLAAKKQELKLIDFYIASLIKTRNRHLPKTKSAASELF